MYHIRDGTNSERSGACSWGWRGRQPVGLRRPTGSAGRVSAADPTPGVAPPRLWRRRKLVAWRRPFMAESKASRMALHVYGRVETRSHGAVVMRPRLWPHRHFYGGEPRRRPAGLILGTKSASAVASLWPRRKTYGHELRRLHGVVAGARRLWRRRKTTAWRPTFMASSKDASPSRGSYGHLERPSHGTPTFTATSMSSPSRPIGKMHPEALRSLQHEVYLGCQQEQPRGTP